MRAIVAMTPSRVIGRGKQIPWRISEDFKWFKQATMGCSLLMGRTTFESIGKPLPGRFTYVMTTDPEKLRQKGTELYSYIDGGDLSYADGPWNKLWICGGAKIYAQFVPLCTEVYASIILEEHEGDVYMPEFEHLFPHSQIVKEYKDFWVVRYYKHV